MCVKEFKPSAAYLHAHLAQQVEHALGKDEVTSPILVVGSSRFVLLSDGRVGVSGRPPDWNPGISQGKQFDSALFRYGS
jgi:hypothetical protein